MPCCVVGQDCILRPGSVGQRHALPGILTIFVGAVALFALAPAARAAEDPVQWSLAPASPSVAPGGTILARLTATLEPGWHLYAPTTPKGGPIPTTLALASTPAIAAVRIYEPQPERRFDPNFQLDTETFAKEAVFLVAIELSRDAPADRWTSPRRCATSPATTKSVSLRSARQHRPASRSTLRRPCRRFSFRPATTKFRRQAPTPPPFPLRRRRPPYNRKVWAAFCWWRWPLDWPPSSPPACSR